MKQYWKIIYRELRVSLRDWLECRPGQPQADSYGTVYLLTRGEKPY